jgi:hypothetical protein
MLCKPSIKSFIHLIEHKIKQIETRDERWGQVNIPSDGHLDIVFRPDGIGCR